jgi:hypothetical protein
MSTPNSHEPLADSAGIVTLSWARFFEQYGNDALPVPRDPIAQRKMVTRSWNRFLVLIATSPVPQVTQPIVDNQGYPTWPWYRFFEALP